MTRGRSTPLKIPRIVNEAQADAALQAFAPNPLTIIRAGPAKTPAGLLPLVMCEHRDDFAEVIRLHHKPGEMDAAFEIQYALGVDGVAWFALKGTFPGHALTWVFRLPEHIPLLDHALKLGYLAVGIQGFPVLSCSRTRSTGLRSR